MKKLLTIVVPVYKVEPYINKCLDSLVIAPELMDKMDVLIINDGTPDNSAEMSREYVKRFPNIFRQIDKENGGHGSVWNMGVKEAYGKYIKFLDSDDWLTNLDKFIVELEKTDADLVLTYTHCHCEHNEVWKSEILDMEYYRTYDADTFDWLGNRTHNYLLHHMCAYKTTVFRQYLPLFLEKQPYDDVVLWPAAMIGAKSLVAFDFELYHYLMDRPGQSISEEVQRKNRWAKIKTDKHTLRFYIEHPVDTSSTKAAFIRKKMPNMYGGWITASTNLPYREGKETAKDWNSFIHEVSPNYTNRWVKLYRVMPYWMFRCGYKSLVALHKMLKRENGPARYVPVKE